MNGRKLVEVIRLDSNSGTTFAQFATKYFTFLLFQMSLIMQWDVFLKRWSRLGTRT